MVAVPECKLYSASTWRCCFHNILLIINPPAVTRIFNMQKPHPLVTAFNCMNRSLKRIRIQICRWSLLVDMVKIIKLSDHPHTWHTHTHAHTHSGIISQLKIAFADLLRMLRNRSRRRLCKHNIFTATCAFIDWNLTGAAVILFSSYLSKKVAKKTFGVYW